MHHQGIHHLRIWQKRPGSALAEASDAVVVEEPLEIRISYGEPGNRRTDSLAVTMRTPGHDAELALGFLLTEGLLGSAQDVAEIQEIPATAGNELHDNRLLVSLRPHVRFDMARVERHFYTSSSCGICGKASIEQVRAVSCYYPQPGQPKVDATVLNRLPQAQRLLQSVFEATGGIHAAALFDETGEMLLLREDVGRHNALDKLVGAAMLQQWLPLRSHIILVSGRAGFELVQKCAMAGIPILAAVGAPSSLAVELAEESGMTLIGFLRDERFNVYSCPERIQAE